jgi:hypothetical protein
MIVIYIQPFPRKIQKIKTASGTFMVEFRKRNINVIIGAIPPKPERSAIISTHHIL